jgi:hypothetical protein
MATTWMCRRCLTRNLSSLDECVKCEMPRNFDPNEETKVLPAVRVAEEEPGGTIKAEARDED